MKIDDKIRLEFLLWVNKMSDFRGLTSRQAVDAAIRASESKVVTDSDRRKDR